MTRNTMVVSVLFLVVACGLGLRWVAPGLATYWLATLGPVIVFPYWSYRCVRLLGDAWQRKGNHRSWACIPSFTSVLAWLLTLAALSFTLGSSMLLWDVRWDVSMLRETLEQQARVKTLMFEGASVRGSVDFAYLWASGDWVAHGQFRSWYLEGDASGNTTPSRVIPFCWGYAQGPCRYWHRNRTLMASGAMYRGLPLGTWSYYYANGQLAGIRDHIWRESSVYWGPDGTPREDLPWGDFMEDFVLEGIRLADGEELLFDVLMPHPCSILAREGRQGLERRRVHIRLHREPFLAGGDSMVASATSTKRMSGSIKVPKLELEGELRRTYGKRRQVSKNAEGTEDPSGVLRQAPKRVGQMAMVNPRSWSPRPSTPPGRGR
jgi:hypothetical protein